MIELLIAVFGGGAAAMGVLALRRKDPVIASRIEQLRMTEDNPGRPAPRRPRVLEALGRKHPAVHEPIQKRLLVSGIEWSVEAFLGAKTLLAICGALLGITMGSMAPVFVLVLGFVGYRVPDFLVNARIKERKAAIDVVLPDAVDLLAISTRGGLNLHLALQRVATSLHGPLGEELKRVDREISVGVARADALGSMAKRLESDDAESLVGVLASTERFGVPVADALESFATEIRGKRRREAEEHARKAPVKILFPLVLCILPAFVLLTVVPLLLGTFRSLGF